MKHEIITLADVQIIGMAKEIEFCKGQKSALSFGASMWKESLSQCLWNTRHQTPFSRQPSTTASVSSDSALVTFLTTTA